MKFTLASLIVGLYAGQVNATLVKPKHYSFHDSKAGICQYSEDIDDLMKPRAEFNLFQVGPDSDIYSFKLKMQAYNIGAPGDVLTVNRF